MNGKTIPIYCHVKAKLLTHGVENTRDGRLTISDRRLFLCFVRIERAVRLDDFETVRRSIQHLEGYASRIGKRHLVLFAYMYLAFSDGSPWKIQRDQQLKDGVVRKTFDYRREVSPNERLIADWAKLWYLSNARRFFRALYANE